MFSRRRSHPVSTMVAVFLAGLLASRPAAAEDKPAAANPPTSAPTGYSPPVGTPAEVDPWLQPSSRPDRPPAPPTYPPGSVLPPGAMPYPPVYPYFMPNPGLAGSPSAANPFSLGGVYVEIRSSSRPVRLDRVISPGMTMPVCDSPCRMVLPRNGVYVITGDGVRTTSQFVLPDDRDRVVLDVKPGSSGDVVFGAVAAGAGLISMYIGLIFVAASELSMNSDPYDQQNRNTGPGKTVGGAMIVGGLIAGIVGIYYIFSTKTEVTSSTGAHFTESPAPKRSRFALTARGLEF